MALKDVWHTSGPTDYGIEVYTHGDCWALAHYMAKITDGNIALIGGEIWRHAMLELDEGYLDIKGIHTDINPLFDEYYVFEREVLSVRPKKSLYTTGMYLQQWGGLKYPPHHMTTYNVAKRLLKKYEVI